MKALIGSRFVRFLAMGALNTAITYGVFLLLHQGFGHQVSYAIAYLSGVVLSYFLNAVVVFRARVSLKSFFSYPVVYVVQYLVGAAVLEAAVQWLGIPSQLAPLLAIVATIPVTFALSRWILVRT